MPAKRLETSTTLIGRRKLLIGVGALGFGAAATAAGVATADTIDTAGAAVRFRVVSANIGRANPASVAKKAIKKVRDKSAPNGYPIVGWQEIDEDDKGDEHQMIKDVFGGRYQNLFMDRNDSNTGDERYKTREPMTIPKTWEVVSRQVHFTHGGLGGVSPSRYITQAHIRHKKYSKLSFVLLNTHYVAGAFNGESDQHEKWRKVHWHNHFKKHKQIVANLVKKGHTVIWTGDPNRRAGMPKVHPNEKRFFKGIDKIGLICPDGQRAAWSHSAAAAPLPLPVEAIHKAHIVEFVWKP